MKKEYSPDKVELLFPSQDLGEELMTFLKKGKTVSKIIAPLAKVNTGLEAPTVEADDAMDMEEEKNFLSINFGKFLKVFKGLKIEQVELWISGATETKGILKLALNVKGEGGIKIVLKPE